MFPVRYISPRLRSGHPQPVVCLDWIANSSLSQYDGYFWVTSSPPLDDTTPPQLQHLHSFNTNYVLWPLTVPSGVSASAKSHNFLPTLWQLRCTDTILPLWISTSCDNCSLLLSLLLVHGLGPTVLWYHQIVISTQVSTFSVLTFTTSLVASAWVPLPRGFPYGLYLALPVLWSPPGSPLPCGFPYGLHLASPVLWFPPWLHLWLSCGVDMGLLHCLCSGPSPPLWASMLIQVFRVQQHDFTKWHILSTSKQMW